MTQHQETGTLSTTAPFSFARSLDFLENFPATQGEQELAAGTLTKAIMIDGHTVAFRLAESGTVEHPELEYTLFSDQPLPEPVKNAVLEQVSFFLSLNDHLKPFYAIGNTDSCFAPIIQHLYGLHHVKFLTLSEAACWAVLAQRIAIPVARKMKQRIVETYGSYIEVGGKRYWAFPELDHLINVSTASLTALIKDERRATYLSNVIAALSHVDENFLRTAPYDEAEAWLRQIKGVGEWSAAFILMRALGRMERMLLDLKPFLAVLPKIYGPDITMQHLADKYGQWFGYWGFYFRVAT